MEELQQISDMCRRYDRIMVVWRRLLKIAILRSESFEAGARRIGRATESYLNRFNNRERPVRDETIPRYIRGLRFDDLKLKLAPLVTERDEVVKGFYDFVRPRIQGHNQTAVRTALRRLAQFSVGNTTLTSLSHGRKVKTLTIRRIAGAMARIPEDVWDAEVPPARPRKRRRGAQRP